MNTPHNRYGRKSISCVCQCCGAQFWAGHAAAKWCSSNCRTQAYRCRLANRPVTPGPKQQQKAMRQRSASTALMVQPTGALEMRQWNGTAIQRRQDGYVNATAMCQANGKLWAKYRESERCGAYLEALEQMSEIRTFDLIQSQRGRSGGTWIHPSLAIDLARWISPAFAVWMDGWFLESLQPQQRTTQLPYGIHVVGPSRLDCNRIWAHMLRKELNATLELFDRELFGSAPSTPALVQFHLA